MIRSGAERRGALIVVILLAALASLGPGPVHADDLGRARRHFAAGQRLYAAGDWARAFAAYEAAYAAAPLPDLLFNMGQCQRKLGNADAALDLFHRFLETGPPAEPRALVLDLVRELESQGSAEPPPAPPEPPPPRETVRANEVPREEIVAPEPVPEPHTPREPTGRGPGAAFWVVGGAGAVALVAAGVLTALAEAGRSEFLDRIEARDPQGAEDVADDTEALYVARNVTAVVSAATLAGAAVLFLIGSGSDQGEHANREDRLAFGARLWPGGAFVEGSGRW